MSTSHNNESSPYNEITESNYLRSQNQEQEYLQHEEDVGQGHQFTKVNDHGNKETKPQLSKSSLEILLEQLQSRIFHQIILKYEFQSQEQFNKQLLKKLSQDITQTQQQLLVQITKTQQKLSNPLLNHFQKQQIKQNILSLRMQEVANTKVMVNTYRHHEYRLVFAYLHISLVYQELNCHEQSLGHLESAVQINKNYLEVGQDVRYFHSLLMALLAKSHLSLENCTTAVEILNKAISIQEQLAGQLYDLKKFFALDLLAKSLSSSGKDLQAIETAKSALNASEQQFSSQSIEYANACKTLAQVQSNAHQYTSAQQHIQRGLYVVEHNLTDRQDRDQIIIEFYTRLAQITLKKLNSTKDHQSNPANFDPYIEVLRKKYQNLENTYGYRDKRVIKEKRHLASSYLKYSKISEAQQTLEDILQIEEVVYGQKSVEVAKTLKLLGTIAMSQNQIKKAEKYLKKSQSIFHDQGHTNLQKQVQAKMLVLTGNAKFLINTKP